MPAVPGLVLFKRCPNDGDVPTRSTRSVAPCDPIGSLGSDRLYRKASARVMIARESSLDAGGARSQQVAKRPEAVAGDGSASTRLPFSGSGLAAQGGPHGATGDDRDAGWAPAQAGGARPRVSIVIPAKNEARNLPHVLSKLPKDCEIILVDGHSTDDTVRVAQRVMPDIVVVGSDSRREGERARLRVRRRRGRVHRDDGRRRLERPGRDSPLRRRARGRSGLRQGVTLLSRWRERRHQHAPPNRQLLAQQDRQRALQDALHRPLLRLQRVPTALPQRHATQPTRYRRLQTRGDALGRRLRDRDPDHHTDRQGRAQRHQRSQASSRSVTSAPATSTPSPTACACCGRSTRSACAPSEARGWTRLGPRRGRICRSSSKRPADTGRSAATAG